MSKRKHTKTRPARPQTRVTFYRRRKQPEAPQSAPEATKRLLLSTWEVAPGPGLDRTDRFLTKYLEHLSRYALAGQWDKFQGSTSKEQALTLYRRTYAALQLTACGLPPVDLSDALPPQQVEALAAAG